VTSRVARKRDGADRPLAATFRRNAVGFHAAAEAALPRHPEATRYFLAIAIELALKAHLLHRGSATTGTASISATTWTRR